jgi:crossover junction endodeoxyribonuclease RuvC
MKVCAVDPGITGAIAVWNTTNDELELFDMPIVTLKRDKRTASEVSAQLLSEMIAGRGIGYGVVEKVAAMPGQGVSGMFSLGRSLGVVEGVLASYDIPTRLVPPQTWQKHFSLKGKKHDADGSRNLAMQRFPQHAAQFARKKDNGRADAALVALWYVETAWRDL